MSKVQCNRCDMITVLYLPQAWNLKYFPIPFFLFTKIHSMQLFTTFSMHYFQNRKIKISLYKVLRFSSRKISQVYFFFTKSTCINSTTTNASWSVTNLYIRIIFRTYSGVFPCFRRSFVVFMHSQFSSVMVIFFYYLIMVLATIITGCLV